MVYLYSVCFENKKNLFFFFLHFNLDEKKWWNRYDAKQNGTTRTSKNINIETTSYGLLAMLKNGQYTNGFPYFKWLISQQNNKGGFIGTQDTIIGLQALAEYAERIAIKNNNVQIIVNTDVVDDKETIFNIEPNNALILQTNHMPSNVRSIHVNATGHGFALFQLSYMYYINATNRNSSFRIESTKLLNSTNRVKFALEICVK